MYVNIKLKLFKNKFKQISFCGPSILNDSNVGLCDIWLVDKLDLMGLDLGGLELQS